MKHVTQHGDCRKSRTLMTYIRHTSSIAMVVTSAFIKQENNTAKIIHKKLQLIFGLRKNSVIRTIKVRHTHLQDKMTKKATS